jgi:hypothetical protein
MSQIPAVVEVQGVPPHVQSWTVAKIAGFVPAVLKRWKREYGDLPTRFSIVMSPQVEINAGGGLPDRVRELTDARLRCRHFTGCHRPYFVVLLFGADADARRAEIQAQLAWSEGYSVELKPESVCLAFADATEDLEDAPEPTATRPRLQDLIDSGALVKILA